MSNNVFYTAVEAHIAWKLRLQKHLDGTSTESLDPDHICKDDQCVLGKWIYSDGQQYKGNEAFDDLRSTHANFHICASEIIRRKNEGDPSEAERLFKKDYVELSKNITRMLVKINAKFNSLRKLG